MVESGEWVPLAISLVAVVIIAAGLAKAVLERVKIPGLVGFLLIGVLLRLLDNEWEFMSDRLMEIFDFLAQVGIVVLLFEVGVETNLGGLMNQLGRAVIVWMFNIIGSALVPFLVAYYLLSFDIIPSLFVSAALTATSVGVVVDVWRGAGWLQSELGELLIDVAELDDISAVLMVTVLLSITPLLHAGHADSALLTIAGIVGWALLKALAFGAACLAFANYLEKRVTDFVKGLERSPDPMLTLLSVGFLIAALGALLGFSIAIGAFFAGLAFSRDPDAVKMGTDIESIRDFFLPFFFVSIGYSVSLGALSDNAFLLAAILVTAVVGKLAGSCAPVWRTAGATSGLLIGVSMIPRAEFTMVVMAAGRTLGDWAVPADLFAAAAGTVLITSTVTPVVLRQLLARSSLAEYKELRARP